MKHANLAVLINHVRRLATAPETLAQTDAELLERFAWHHDQKAFAALLQRHCGIVWRVCQHVLRREHDVEDAFQATFLVLAQKARSIRKVGSLASWLHGTAFRISMRAKRDAGRRFRHERRAKPIRPRVSASASAWLDLQATLDREVRRLPTKQQDVFVLCVLDGKSRAEAAATLEWSEGTVSSTLARARKTLRIRLAKRGIILSAVLAGLDVARRTSTAAPLDQTLAIVLDRAAKIPPAVAELARGAVTVISTRMKIVVALLVIVAAASATAAVAHFYTPSKSVPPDDRQLIRDQQDAAKDGSRTVPTFAPVPDSSKGSGSVEVKRLHTLSKEVYGAPMFVTADKGSCLLVWVDLIDPTVKPRIPGLPMPEPKYDVLVYDPATGKERGKLPTGKANVTHVGAIANGGGLPRHRVEMTRDGKALAFVDSAYHIQPGQIDGSFTTAVKVVDLESFKVRPVTDAWNENKGAEEVNILFAPDGALVILRETKCIVQELDKDKPRLTFDIERPEDYKKKAGLNHWYDAIVSSDSKYLAVAVDGIVTVYDLATGKKILSSTRPCPEVKKVPWDPEITQTSLAFSLSTTEPRLLVTETVYGVPKDFIQARLFDLKEKKEIGKVTLCEHDNKEKQGALGGGGDFSGWQNVHSFFTGSGEPRVVFVKIKDPKNFDFSAPKEARVLDGATGKVLRKFDAGAALEVSPDGKYMMLLKPKSSKFSVEIWSLEGD